jgi:hypothetical protein
MRFLHLFAPLIYNYTSDLPCYLQHPPLQQQEERISSKLCLISLSFCHKEVSHTSRAFSLSFRAKGPPEGGTGVKKSLPAPAGNSLKSEACDTLFVCRTLRVLLMWLAADAAKEGTGVLAGSHPTSLKTPCVFRALGPSTPLRCARNDSKVCRTRVPGFAENAVRFPGARSLDSASLRSE